MNKDGFSFVLLFRHYLWIVVLLSVTFAVPSCSRHHFPVSSPNVSDSQLKSFIGSGTGMRLNTGRTRPGQLIRTARQYLGTSYCMGGTTSRCLDCSGLTYVSFAAHNIEFPHRSQDQARYGRLILNQNELKPGDLVFFTRSYNTPDFITHVGIYIGDNRFIHASTSSGVIITPLANPWWRQRYVFGTRVF
jgi:murein DD-endopeptidase / murein LD-carboxypeptidase